MAAELGLPPMERGAYFFGPTVGFPGNSVWAPNGKARATRMNRFILLPEGSVLERNLPFKGGKNLSRFRPFAKSIYRNEKPQGWANFDSPGARSADGIGFALIYRTFMRVGDSEIADPCFHSGILEGVGWNPLSRFGGMARVSCSKSPRSPFSAMVWISFLTSASNGVSSSFTRVL